MKEKLLEFKIDDIKVGKCKFIDTDTGSFEVCRSKEKIEIYAVSTRL